MKKLSPVMLSIALTISAAAQTSHFDGHTWWITSK